MASTGLWDWGLLVSLAVLRPFKCAPSPLHEPTLPRSWVSIVPTGRAGRAMRGCCLGRGLAPWLDAAGLEGRVGDPRTGGRDEHWPRG
jgi:hypothetical protein